MKNLLSKKEVQPPSTPDGRVIYAIGDIHGRADLLALLLEAILEEVTVEEGAATVVGLGDYVDRGPDSRGVLELLAALRGVSNLDLRLLRGNHEDTMLKFLDDATAGRSWCEYGGRETLASYGVQPPENPDDAGGWEAARAAFKAAIPQAHLDLLNDTTASYEAGDYFFCHAGARPGVPLEEQSDHDLMWIRKSFLDDTKRFSKVIVHGHSVGEAVQADHRRIGVDTGAYATSALTAVKLVGPRRFLLQTRRSPNNTFKVGRSVL